MPEENLVGRYSAKIVTTLVNLFKRDGLLPEYESLSEGDSELLITGYDNWGGGTDIYGIFCKIPIEIYSRYELEIQSIEERIKKKQSESLGHILDGLGRWLFPLNCQTPLMKNLSR